MANRQRGFLKPVQKIVDGVAVVGTKYSDPIDLTRHSGPFSLWLKCTNAGSPSATVKMHPNYALDTTAPAASRASTDFQGNADTVVEDFTQTTLCVEPVYPIIAPFIVFSFEPGAGDDGSTTLEMWIVQKGG